jgi:hypothetical protein
MRNAFGKSVHCYCILDRDYHPDVEIEERLQEAATKGVQLHIWRRNEVQMALREYAEQMKDEATDAIADELSRREPKLRAGGASRRARQIVENKRCGERGLIDVVSGKTLLSQMSAWCQNRCGLSLSAVVLAKSLHLGDIDSEVSTVLRSIERLENFSQNCPDRESA